MPAPDEPIDDDRVALFDHIARFTQIPDTTLHRVAGALAGDDRLRLPLSVHDALLDRDEILAFSETELRP
jgi:hypothetical protein